MAATIFYDGECNLCDGFVQFVIDRDPQEYFQFVALQSDKGRELLAQHGQQLAAVPSTIFLLSAGRLYRESEAVLRILRQLDSPWRYAAGLRYLPAFLRDAGYRLVARHRYLILGRQVACRLPTPELRRRFL